MNSPPKLPYCAFVPERGARRLSAGMGQSRPPAGEVEQRDAGIFRDGLNRSRDSTTANFRFAAAAQSRALAGPNGTGPDGTWG